MSSSNQSSTQASSSRASDLKPLLMTLPDGRTLAYAIYGHASNATNGIPPVFYFHGYPASHHEAHILDSAAKKHGIVLIAPTRPGMGFSTHQQRRHLLDWPADVLSLAEHLNVGRFGVIGLSGGGPYVLACWQAIPRARLVAASIIGGLYPASLGLKGMLRAPRMLLTLAPLAPWLVAASMNWGGMKAAARDFEHPEKLEKLLDDEMKSRPEVDRIVYSQNEGGIRETTIESTREALRQGGDGPAWEAKLYGSEWGFYLDELQADNGRLMMWHGELDANVPVTMAEKAASLLKGADLTVIPGEGQCGVIVHKADDIMAALKQKLMLQ